MKVGDQIAIRPKGLVNSRLAHPDSLVYFGADVPDAQVITTHKTHLMRLEIH